MNAYETHENTARRYGWTVVRSGVIGYRRGDMTVSVQYSANGNVVSATRAIDGHATEAVLPRYGAKRETVNGWLATPAQHPRVDDVETAHAQAIAIDGPTVTLDKERVRTDELGSTGENIAEVMAVVTEVSINHGMPMDYPRELRSNDLTTLKNYFYFSGQHSSIETASQNLGAFMLAVQAATFDATGVMPVPCSDAPNNYGELLQAAARWQYALGDVFLPVWDGASNDSIYGSAAANHAFRYWHDMGHIAHHCDFTPDGEFNLQFDHHLPIVADHFGIDSLEYRMYFADTIGQIEYVVENGRFPANQAQFVSTYVRNARLALNTDY
jgi:hypothetical protein